MRQPMVVMDFLDRLFAKFDALAKKYRLFKVSGAQYGWQAKGTPQGEGGLLPAVD